MLLSASRWPGRKFSGTTCSLPVAHTLTFVHMWFRLAAMAAVLLPSVTIPAETLVVVGPWMSVGAIGSSEEWRTVSTVTQVHIEGLKFCGVSFFFFMAHSPLNLVSVRRALLCTRWVSCSNIACNPSGLRRSRPCRQKIPDRATVF